MQSAELMSQESVPFTEVAKIKFTNTQITSRSSKDAKSTKIL